MSRLVIGGGNTRVGEVYLDAVFRQRALDQQANEQAMRWRMEQERAARSDAQAEQAAREAALNRAHQEAMARQSQEFQAEQNQLGREAETGRINAEHTFQSNRDVAQSALRLKELQQTDALATKRITEAHEREKWDALKQLAASKGVTINKDSTEEEILAGVSARARQTNDDAEWSPIAALGKEVDGMPEKWRQVARAVAAKEELKLKVQFAEGGHLDPNDPFFQTKEGAGLRNVNQTARQAVQDVIQQRKDEGERRKFNDMMSTREKINSDRAHAMEKFRSQAQTAGRTVTDAEVEAVGDAAVRPAMETFNKIYPEAAPALKEVAKPPEKKLTEDERMRQAIDPRFMTTDETEMANTYDQMMKASMSAAHPSLPGKLFNYTGRALAPAIDAIHSWTTGRQPARNIQFNDTRDVTEQAFRAVGKDPKAYQLMWLKKNAPGETGWISYLQDEIKRDQANEAAANEILARKDALEKNRPVLPSPEAVYPEMQGDVGAPGALGPAGDSLPSGYHFSMGATPRSFLQPVQLEGNYGVAVEPSRNEMARYFMTIPPEERSYAANYAIQQYMPTWEQAEAERRGAAQVAMEEFRRMQAENERLAAQKARFKKADQNMYMGYDGNWMRGSSGRPNLDRVR